VGSLVFLVVRTLRLLRGFRSSSALLTEALSEVTASAEATAARAETLAAGSERMAGSVERLARSRARLRVLTAAIDEVRDSAGRITGVVPRK
jgi:methyl-accepting chemotaxis protein